MAKPSWVDDRRFLYDLLGKGLTLLRSPAEPDSGAALIQAAEAAAVPLTAVDLAHPELRELYGADLVLVRPDQHVAWRGDVVTDGVSLLDAVRGNDDGELMRQTRDAS